MSKSEDVINRAYRNIPKEIAGFNMNLDGFPFRGIKYYLLLMKRKIYKIMRV
jgi:hypothetical protein